MGSDVAEEPEAFPGINPEQRGGCVTMIVKKIPEAAHNKENNADLFEGRRIRKAWDDEGQRWLYSIIDVVGVLTDQPDYNKARKYWKVLKGRSSKEGNEMVTNCYQLKMLAADGKMRLTDVANTEQLLSLIRSIPSKKTEQFKQWLEERENETIRPSIENKGEIILYQPDSSIEINVLIENDTVWLTQAQMAELFQTTRPNITTHLRNIFDDGELKEISVSKDFLHTAADGKRYAIKHYNLDAIISVGYRVKSMRGVQFRQWSSGVLKDYIIKGYAINERFERIEGRVTETEKKIDFFVRTSLPPVQGILSEGQIFDAHVFASDLIKSAKGSIMLLDNYVDESVLLLLSKRRTGVSAEILTKNASPQLRLDLERHNAQYEPIVVYESDRFHDRFLIIDDTVYFIGSSLKDLGKKLFAFSKMEMKGSEILKSVKTKER